MTRRPPFTRRERTTGQRLTVGRAEDLGMEALPGAGWLVVCEEHGTLVAVPTRRVALSVTGLDFCESCGDALA
jgi:hypothetical protein